MHLQRHDHAIDYEPGHGIIEVLERDAPGWVFSTWTNTLIDLQAARLSVSSWGNPSLTILRGTLLRAQDFTLTFHFQSTSRQERQDHCPKADPPRFAWRSSLTPFFMSDQNPR
jgi:hypothetical protein